MAIAAGIAAGLVSLIGFGIDSGIESIAAVLVGLRLAARLRDGEADERRERRTLRLVSVTFFLLAAYVTIEGIRRSGRRRSAGQFTRWASAACGVDRGDATAGPGETPGCDPVGR